MELGTGEGFAKLEPRHVRAANGQLLTDLLEPIMNNHSEVGRSACCGANGEHQPVWRSKGAIDESHPPTLSIL